jgi:hypothetical protein
MIDTLRTRLCRLPFVALGLLSLVCGAWGGLIRLPLNLPLAANQANWITYHGPLMVCGFLGTVIALERAAGLHQWWTYAAPALTGIGALVLIAGIVGHRGIVLITAGSALFLAVTLRVVQLQRALFTIVMSIAGGAWLIGNILWLRDWPVNRLVPWWIAFLGLTIIGERLDLSRFQRQTSAARPLLLLALTVFVVGTVLSAALEKPGERLSGVGLAALAAWLGRFDIARRTLKQPGLPRFMALCLLIGFIWLGVAGVLLCFVPPLVSGPYYDAPLHAFFLGFVFSMIFGHAPVIFPSVLLRPVAFSSRFYAHLALLHLGVVLRVSGDLADWWPGRRWGGALNALALGLFLINTVASLVWNRPNVSTPAGKSRRTLSPDASS